MTRYILHAALSISLVGASTAYADAPQSAPFTNSAHARAKVSKKTIAGAVLVGVGGASFVAAVGTGMTYVGGQIVCGIGASGEPGPSSCGNVDAGLRSAAIGMGVAALLTMPIGAVLLARGRVEDRQARTGASFASNVGVGVAPLLGGSQGGSGAMVSLGGRF